MAAFENISSELGLATDAVNGDLSLLPVDLATAADTLASQYGITLAAEDTATAAEELACVYYGVSSDTATASDASTGALDLLLADTARATDASVTAQTTVAALADLGRGRDTVAVVVYGVAAETGNAADTLGGAAATPGVLSEAGYAGETLGGDLSASAVVADTATATDAVAALWLANAEDLAEASDTLNPAPVVAMAALAELAAVGTDALSGALAVYAPVLTESAAGSDSSVTVVTLVGVLSDTALAGDGLAESAQMLHVMNAETGAISTYTLTPTVSGVAEFGGVLYLAGPDGLYALDAEQDEDGSIVWQLRTGVSDLGTPLLKRIQDVNVQARTEGDTTLQIVSGRYGDKHSYQYRLPPLNRASYRDGIVKVGRGVQSVYYGFGLRGVGPTEIDQLRFTIEPLSRRR